MAQINPMVMKAPFCFGGVLRGLRPTHQRRHRAGSAGGAFVDRKLDGIDHVIIGVHDLEAARERYAGLGFNTTPRGRHIGWGTANYCIMLEDGYLELLGIVDPDGFSNGLDRFLETGEGLLALVAASRDAEGTAAAWAKAGLSPAEPQSLGRELETAEGPSALRFRNVLLPTDTVAGLRLFACQHLTPELLRQPRWLSHPNGARRLRSCTIVAEDPAAVTSILARVFGSGNVTSTDRVVAIHVGRAVVLVATPEDAALMHPMAAIPETVDAPALRVVTIEVADVARAARFLTLQGISFRQSREGALIPPPQAHGAALELVR
jgi:hypothetical protein